MTITDSGFTGSAIPAVTLLSIARPSTGSLLAVVMTLQRTSQQVGNVVDPFGTTTEGSNGIIRNRAVTTVQDSPDAPSGPNTWFPEDAAENATKGHWQRYFLQIRVIDGTEPNPMTWTLVADVASAVNWWGIHTVDDGWASGPYSTFTTSIRAGKNGDVIVPSIHASTPGARLWTYLARNDDTTTSPSSPSSHGQSLALAQVPWTRFDWDPFAFGPTGDVLAGTCTPRWIGYNVLALRPPGGWGRHRYGGAGFG